jgi:hypothetical protein
MALYAASRPHFGEGLTPALQFVKPLIVRMCEYRLTSNELSKPSRKILITIQRHPHKRMHQSNDGG